MPGPSRKSVYGNEPTRTPDIEAVGKAWRIGLASDVPDHQASVSSWLVRDGSGAHPFWWWYSVGCIHLRPIEGVKPAHVRFPGASHEILFVALSPEKPLPSLERWENMAYLTPIDLEHQFIAGSDEQAAEVCELVVRHICAGQSPDQDFRAVWRSIIDKTAEHARLGGHPDG